MNTILSELWSGTLEPDMVCGVGNRELQQLARKIEQNRERLQQLLTAEQSAIFEDLLTYGGKYEMLYAEAAFIQGFSVATRMLCQSFNPSLILT